MKKEMKKRLIAVVLAATVMVGDVGIAAYAAVSATAIEAEAKSLSKKKARKKLVKWMKKHGVYQSNLILSYDGIEDGAYVFQYYEDMGDHTATSNWYYVDRNSGAISSMF